MKVQIKLQRLPDRIPVKVTIMVPPELHSALNDYAAAYEAQFGDAQPAAELIPAMLAAFLQSDRAFARSRQNRGSSAPSAQST